MALLGDGNVQPYKLGGPLRMTHIARASQARAERWRRLMNECAIELANPDLRDQQRHICQTARKHDVPVFFEPTSVPKSVSAAENGILSLCTFTSPNEAELAAMASAGIGAGRDLPIL